MKNPIIFNSRRSNRNRNVDLVQVAPEIERQARRLNRQQKRLEKNMGLDGVKTSLEGSPRQKVIRYQDIKKIEPLTDTQADFFDAWDDDQATGYVLYGSAGTGKTYAAAALAIQDVLDPNKPEFKKLIIVRSATAVRSQGFMPGDILLKQAVYELPYHTIFADLTGKKDAYENLKEMGKIEFQTSSFIRGITFDDSIIIFDEFQSANLHEISSVATRVGKNTKIIFCGDGKQDDLIYNKNDTSGFKSFMEITKIMTAFRGFRFTEDDILRSGFVREYLIAANKLGL